jgi:pantoate--beta-alanine ligase
MRQVIESEPGVSLDYAELVDADSFEPVMACRKVCYALVAARVGSTRLIDNALIEQAGDSFTVTV